MADYEEHNEFVSEETIPAAQETVTEAETPAEPIAQQVNECVCEPQANASADAAPSHAYEAPVSAYEAPASAYTAPASPYTAPANPGAAPASPYAAPANPYTAQANAYARPEAPRSAYSDAGYIPASDAGTMPKSYYCAAPAERKPKKERRARRGMHPAAIIALCLVCAILGGLAGGAGLKLLTKQTVSETAADTSAERSVSAGTNETTTLNVAGGSTKTVTTNTVLSGGEMSATDIYYNLALNQVVGVKTEITYTNVFGYTTKGAVSGSGFIISEDGYVLTNYHVIQDAVTGGYDVQVLTYNGETYIAEVIGYEPDNDVAVLKIDAAGLNAAVLGDSDEINVGEQVYAVGNPLGELAYSMTEGIVSAKDREITTDDSTTGQTTTINMFQTTAAINSGNSGGPIYNDRGQVIGIATAKTSATGVEGLGFAIPINDAVRIARDLITDGYVRGKAYMGVDIGTVTASAAQYYGLVQGAIVGSVEPGSCSEAAGLKASDIIVAIDGKEILTRNELIAAKKNYHAGDSAVLKVYREGQYLELTIVFDEATPDMTAQAEEPEDVQQTPSQQQMSPEDLFRQFFGGSGSPFGR